MSVSVGQAAPAFSAQDQNGSTVSLAQYAGKYVVLYFYPKDDTPGCTVEACAFRDDHSTLTAAGAVVLGVSPDDAKSHTKFITKYSLPFSLLADTDNAVAKAYGAWGEKSMYGRTYMGILRSTFLIGPDGAVKYAWPKVKPEGHSAEVLAALEAVKAGKPVATDATAPAPAPAKAAAKPVAAKKVAKKVAAKKPAAKKVAAKKPAAKKVAAKKPVAKKPAKGPARKR
ncbi:MAG: thioredoxin-dependent thiol peroxidase [Myxococcaceae bacterium]|jgi:peroxiredoxin Q/BCP|nr:thioredoxin-dependent thiol peroxidase [Myxococcaceae bacterium]MCA3012871.1 thioredoxin-dependent thiol peroxidase [Myxococcaceae bacterium]